MITPLWDWYFTNTLLRSKLSYISPIIFNREPRNIRGSSFAIIQVHSLFHAKEVVGMTAKTFFTSCMFYGGQDLTGSYRSNTHQGVREVRANLKYINVFFDDKVC